MMEQVVDVVAKEWFCAERPDREVIFHGLTPVCGLPISGVD